MSDTEINKGRLIPIDDIDYFVKEKVTDEMFERLSWCDDRIMAAFEYEIIAEVNGQWYEIDWDVRGDTDMHFVDVNEDIKGVIHFHTMHYNGGAHWTEVVEEGLKYGNR